MKYNELTANKTSVYISHRLASTRFCDRIVYLENGEIVECDSHDELMKLSGKYAHMFELQSHYYRAPLNIPRATSGEKIFCQFKQKVARVVHMLTLREDFL